MDNTLRADSGPHSGPDSRDSLRPYVAVAVCAWTAAALLATLLVAGTVMAAEPGAANGPANRGGNGNGDAGAKAQDISTSTGSDADVAQTARQLALDAGQRAAAATPNARVEVEVGQLDPRLHLAACQRVQPYLPDGTRPWGKSRIGLRCLQGTTLWNVYLPVTVKVFARGVVARAPLPAGTVLSAGDLHESEVDLAAGYSPALGETGLAVGRTLQHAVAAGDALHVADLKARQYFTAGSTVDVVAVGSGYQVSSQGQAMTPGLEGQTVRIRTASGKIISGVAVGERRVEIQL